MKAPILFLLCTVLFGCKPRVSDHSSDKRSFTVKLTTAEKLMGGRWVELDGSSPFTTVKLKYSPYPDDDTSFVKSNSYACEFKKDGTVQSSSIYKYRWGNFEFFRDGQWSTSGDSLLLEMVIKNEKGDFHSYKCVYQLHPKEKFDIDLVHVRTVYEKNGHFSSYDLSN